MKTITRVVDLIALALSGASALAQKRADESPAQKYFTDVQLTNQDGEKLRFYSDLIKGKVIVMNSFFATCTGVCPPMTRNLVKVQEALGDRFGRDIFFISITVDPTTDTPASLKAYATKFKAKSGWTFVTGEQANVEAALKKVGQFVQDKNDHQTILIIGNDRTGLWKKAFAMAATDDLVKVVESVLNDKGQAVPSSKAGIPQ